jgi:hypothetical protein
MTTMSSAFASEPIGSVLRLLRRGIIVAAVLLAGLGGAGCSALRLGYAAAPDVVFWWFDAYVDFDEAQSPRAREAVVDWFAWHRRTQLPDYAALLARAQAELPAETTGERICAWWQEGRERTRSALERGLPALGALAVTLAPRQIAHVEARLAKKNAEYAEQFLQPDPAERRAAGVKRAVERAEMVYGRVDDAMRERIAQLAAASPFDAEMQFAERKARQQELLALLRSVAGGPPDRAMAGLRAWWQQVERSPREAYRRYAERLNPFLCHAAAQVHNGATPAQRQAAVQRFKGWEADLRALAADTRPPVVGAEPARP